MKIIKAEAWPLSMKMEEGYAVTYAVADTAHNVFFRVETSSGLSGYGCTGPDPDVTGETASAVLTHLNETAIPLLVGEETFARESLLQRLRESTPKFPSVWNVVDSALHDLAAKQSGLPLWKWLGGFRHRVLTSQTIGILPEKETVERAKHWVAQGFRCLKIKGGHDWENDTARLHKLRETLGNSILLRFDANQGYTSEETLKFAAAVEPLGIEFIEQPVRVGESFPPSPIPLMADETVLSARDAFHFLRRVECGLLNVKLAKSGGIQGAQEIAAVSAAAGAGLMVGCMDESALGIAAGLAFALSSRAVEYADLDGHIGLIGDPAADLLPLREGYLYPSELPGLGFHS